MKNCSFGHGDRRVFVRNFKHINHVYITDFIKVNYI